MKIAVNRYYYYDYYNALPVRSALDVVIGSRNYIDKYQYRS